MSGPRLLSMPYMRNMPAQKLSTNPMMAVPLFIDVTPLTLSKLEKHGGGADASSRTRDPVRTRHRSASRREALGAGSWWCDRLANERLGAKRCVLAASREGLNAADVRSRSGVPLARRA